MMVGQIWCRGREVDGYRSYWRLIGYWCLFGRSLLEDLGRFTGRWVEWGRLRIVAAAFNEIVETRKK